VLLGEGWQQLSKALVQVYTMPVPRSNVLTNSTTVAVDEPNQLSCWRLLHSTCAAVCSYSYSCGSWPEVGWAGLRRLGHAAVTGAS
jgi:hypothetical protein